MNNWKNMDHLLHCSNIRYIFSNCSDIPTWNWHILQNIKVLDSKIYLFYIYSAIVCMFILWLCNLFLRSLCIKAPLEYAHIFTHVIGNVYVFVENHTFKKIFCWICVAYFMLFECSIRFIVENMFCIRMWKVFGPFV